MRIDGLVSRLLRLPGAASFRRFDRVVCSAAALAEEFSVCDDAALLAAAGALRAGPGTIDAPWRPQDLARFLALASEAAGRSLGITPFHEQLIACCALLDGFTVEMDTGEGKTLAGALAAAGHALRGRRVHVISVNDYLAERDAAWMGPFFSLLGIGAAWIGQRTSRAGRREAYRCSIVYAPVSEIGFDVLRDRFAVEDDERVAPVFDVAIVDEADSVMVDEAVTPLVLAGASDHRTADFKEETRLVEDLRAEEHFVLAADGSTVVLTDAGTDLIEARLGGVNLYDAEHLPTLTRLNLALHARALMRRDVDYLVADGEIRLISTSRGRVARLQRWPDGLHAAIEAKERLRASAPGMILDTVTIQDLLLRYRSLSGMSGTVTAVAEDLLEFYGLASGRIERHEPNRRVDEPDRVFITREERDSAAVAETLTRHEAGQPVLIGTQSVAESERLAVLLRHAGVTPRVLNAKNDFEEASIIAAAGEHGSVTISTQMSGRGTDIRLGGAEEQDAGRVSALGGLAVVAIGRYPSQRLDAQLRGRAGRQGDPGTGLAFVSLEDELVQQHAPPHLLTAVERQREHLGAGERQRIVDASQKIAEGIRLDRHRATWAYNRAIAAQRAKVLERRGELVEDEGAALREVHDRLPERLRAGENGGTSLAATARLAAIHYLDERWVDHLSKLQEIRDGIHLRSLAGLRPDEEFHRIALREFQGFFDEVRADVLAFLGTLAVDDLGRDLADLGLRRPSATWTYMVTDDPFGSAGDRLARGLGRLWRSRVLQIE